MSKSEREREIAQARERADLARLRFGNAVHGVVERLAPGRLRADAIEVASEQLDQARRDFLQRFRHWPAAIAASAAGLLAMAFWRPARVAARYAFRAGSIAWSMRSLWRSRNAQD